MADIEGLVLPKIGDSIRSSGEILTMTLSVCVWCQIIVILSTR